MSGRPVSWTPGNPQLKLPVVLPSEIRSKGRVALPSELLDKVSWLSAARNSRLEVGLEVRAIGYIQIVPKQIVDSVVATEAELLPVLVRRLFASHVDSDRRLVLPPLFEDRVFPSWSTGIEHSVILECHQDYVSVLTTEAWMKLVASDRTLDQLLSKSSL